MKTCGRCRVEKPLDQFSKNKVKNDGYSNRCKQCVHEYAKANSEKIALTTNTKADTNRICHKCGTEKLLVEFHKDKNKKDGYSYICKKCRLEYYQDQRDLLPHRKLKESLKERRMKICYKCGFEKPLDNFYKNHSTKDGYGNKCKECVHVYSVENKKTLGLKAKSRYEQNRTLRLAVNKEYRVKSKEKMREQRKLRYHHDINFRLQSVLRGRLRRALSGNYKTGSAVRDLGCSIEEFKKYIESKFTDGMSWENYGYYGWHLDHIRPLASFDLSDREQLLKALHYTNLQPLWAKDNYLKGDKLEWAC